MDRATYSEAHLKQLREKLDSTTLDMAELSQELTAKVSPELKSHEAQQYLEQGVCRRLPLLRRTLLDIFEALPPNATRMLSHRERNQVDALIHAYLINIVGCCDNLAWVFLHERGSAISIRKYDVGLFQKATRKLMPPDLQAYLATLDGWNTEYMSNYRDALAHRIPPYLPPFQILPEDTELYQSLGAGMHDALLARDLARHNKLEAQQEALCFPCMRVAHSFIAGEESRPFLFHAQFVVDALTVVDACRHVMQAVTKEGEI